jgi:hypothetical protein
VRTALYGGETSVCLTSFSASCPSFWKIPKAWLPVTRFMPLFSPTEMDSTVGLYAALSEMVVRRTFEIRLRVVLGAPAERCFWACGAGA